MDESPLADGIVYGPVSSRRLGRSLGVNLLPAGVKVCGFNCNYCQLGWTFDLVDPESLRKHRWPEAEEVGEAVGARLAAAKAAGERIDVLTVSGNGEPTLHPDFWRCMTALVEARDREAPGRPIHVLTNGALLGTAQVVSGLNLADVVHVKVDAGWDGMFLEMNSPTFDVSLFDILTALPRLKDFGVQAMFTRGRRDNTTDDEVAKWVELVRKAGPSFVDLTTASRPPADGKVRPAPPEVLESIAARLREVLPGTPVRVA